MPHCASPWLRVSVLNKKSILDGNPDYIRAELSAQTAFDHFTETYWYEAGESDERFVLSKDESSLLIMFDGCQEGQEYRIRGQTKLPDKMIRLSNQKIVRLRSLLGKLHV